MTVPTTIDAAGWLGKYFEADEADGGFPRAMLQAFAEALMSAQAWVNPTGRWQQH